MFSKTPGINLPSESNDATTLGSWNSSGSVKTSMMAGPFLDRKVPNSESISL